jgi:small subunit ribosomal protein S16
MVKIRLSRVGTRKKPKYRIVVADEQAKRDGRFIETIGTYNPLSEPPAVELRKDRYEHWQSHGAQPTKSVLHLLKRYERTGRAIS